MTGSPEPPTVSALIVNRDAGEWLGRCLDRLAAAARSCGGGLLEAVVVDNASRDGSLAAARQFVSPNSPGSPPLPVRVIEAGRNLGFGAACNLAAAESSGRHLLLLNPDAWTDGESLLRLLRALDADQRLAVAAPSLRYPDGSPQFVWAPPVGVAGEAIQSFRNRFERSRWNHEALPRLLAPFVGGWFTAACLLVRRAAFEEVGGFDERFFLYFEDADLCLRLRRAGFRLRRARGARAWHARGVTTGKGRERRLVPAAERRYRASQLRYYDLHRPPWERAFLRRRLARRFAAVADEDRREALLRLLEEA